MFGRKSDPSIREVASGLVNKADRWCNMSSGAPEALLFVTTLPTPSSMIRACLGTLEDAVVVQELKECLYRNPSTRGAAHIILSRLLTRR